VVVRAARLDEGRIGAEVRIGSGVRLHVGEPTSEQLARATAREVLNHVDAVAAAIVATTGIAFRIFVGKHAAHGLEHGDTPTA
jgi:hypothetical protein